MSLPVKIAITLSSFAFQKFLDRYGEEILAYASQRGEEAVRTYGPQVVRWTADTGSSVYGRVAPRASSAASRISAVTGRPAEKGIVPGADETEDGRLSTLLFGPFAGRLAWIGAYLRAAAHLGAEQLSGVTDEQIGAAAVALWRTQNRDSFLGRRVRKRLWKK